MRVAAHQHIQTHGLLVPGSGGILWLTLFDDGIQVAQEWQVLGSGVEQLLVHTVAIQG